MNSITDEARSALNACELNYHEDGSTLFFHIVSQLSMDTFSKAQATQDKLSKFHPKHFKYDIIQVNKYICTAIKTLQVASTAGGTITDQEILYFQFKVYKKIKVSCKMDITYSVSGAMVASTPEYSPDTLFNETESKYTNLTNQGLWCPSENP